MNKEQLKQLVLDNADAVAEILAAKIKPDMTDWSLPKMGEKCYRVNSRGNIVSYIHSDDPYEEEQFIVDTGQGLSTKEIAEKFKSYQLKYGKHLYARFVLQQIIDRDYSKGDTFYYLYKSESGRVNYNQHSYKATDIQYFKCIPEVGKIKQEMGDDLFDALFQG